MSVENNVRKASYFIAVVNHITIDDKEKLRQYELFNSLGVPMYMIVEDGVNWDSLKGIPWKKTYVFTSDFEIPSIMQVINFEFAKGGFNA